MASSAPELRGTQVWHIDENQPGNKDENHYKVGLVQADNQRDLELDHNRGDAGDPYPGSASNTSASSTTTPNTRSYAGANTSVSITSISPSGPSMTANVAVRTKAVLKDLKDRQKDGKEIRKERFKDIKELKEFTKDRKEFLESPAPGGGGPEPDVEARLQLLEAIVLGGGTGEPEP